MLFDRPATPLRWLLAAVVFIVLGGLALTLIQLTDTALSIHQRMQNLPIWLAVPLALALFLLTFAVIWLVWRLLRPAMAKKPKSNHTLDRDTLRQRAMALDQHAALTPSDNSTIDIAQPEQAILNAEFDELDRRKTSGELYVALFGEISTGKSSLIQALSGTPLKIDARGGTTTEVALYQTQLDDLIVTLADVPGTNEVNAADRAIVAREEALRAHVVALVVNGDLSRAQAGEWEWLKAFDKPMLMLLNKVDRFDASERALLLVALKRKFDGADIIPVSAGYQETVQVEHADGRIEVRPRSVAANLAPLKARLCQLAQQGAAKLEPRRERAVLQALELKLSDAEIAVRESQSAQLVIIYTRRAIAGAMAAIAPASDLIIQGALAVAMSKEIAALYEVKLREIDADDLLKLVGGRLKGSVTLALAIAGNAAKAFPGLGTLGGGALHAIAYGLLFQSFGTALRITLASQGRLDQRFLLDRLTRDLKDHRSIIQKAGALAAIAASSGEVKVAVKAR